jgi:hypothetical protein
VDFGVGAQQLLVGLRGVGLVPAVPVELNVVEEGTRSELGVLGGRGLEFGRGIGPGLIGPVALVIENVRSKKPWSSSEAIWIVESVASTCVEGVVHGRDLVPAVEPDGEALALTAEALIALLTETQPNLVPAAVARPPVVWVEIATGRREAPEELPATVPLLS